PWHPAVRTIRFLRDGSVCHIQQLPEHPPEVHIRPPSNKECSENEKRVEWTARHDELPVACTLRFSHDGGRTWRALATNYSQPYRVVNLDEFPGGEECRFQLVASAGIRTATAETDPFVVLRKPMRAHILAPASGTDFRQGDPVTLRGIGFSPNFGTS